MEKMSVSKDFKKVGKKQVSINNSVKTQNWGVGSDWEGSTKGLLGSWGVLAADYMHV